TNVPALYESEESDLGPQSVVQVKPRRTWVEAYGDEQYFYTDNMFLAGHNKQGADVLVSTVQAALAPTLFEVLGGQLAPRLGYQQQWFNYDLARSDTALVYNFNTGAPQTIGLDSFDFNVSTVFGDVTWQWQNWLFIAGADFRRLLDSGTYDEFYREYVPRWSISREFPLTPTTGITVGYDGDYRVTGTHNPPTGYGENYNDRTDQSLFIVGNWQLCRYAVLQPFYRFEYSHYTRVHRDDFLHSFGLTAYCPVTKNVAVRAFVGYDDLNTDGLFAQDYEKLDAGGGINLLVRF
ncbi:MAG: hypothetical protein ACLQSR_15560, partial [Limisphaerales bacterium]